MAARPVFRSVSAKLRVAHACAGDPDITSMLGSLTAMGGIRTEKVAAIRAELAAGTYTHRDKLDAVVDRLLPELDSSY